MNKKAVTWLYEELPDLVAKGVLSPETARRIQEYYGPLPQGVGQRTLLMIFGLIGSVSGAQLGSNEPSVQADHFLGAASNSAGRNWANVMAQKG